LFNKPCTILFKSSFSLKVLNNLGVFLADAPYDGEIEKSELILARLQGDSFGVFELRTLGVTWRDNVAPIWSSCLCLATEACRGSVTAREKAGGW
jgi:hypothetical protein